MKSAALSAPSAVQLSRRRLLIAAGATAALNGCVAPGVPPLPTRETGNAQVNGTRLYYEIAGSGDPVVLIHGFAADMRTWDDQFDVLANNFRVIRYDARGFGKSALPRPDEPYSHADDLRQLLGKLGASQPHVIGVSMGGRIALDYAVTYPDALQSLVVIDAVVGGWTWSKEWLASYSPIVAAGRENDIARAKSLFLAHPVFAPARENPVVGGRLRQMIDDYSGWHFVNPNAERLVTPPTVAQLGKIRVPTLAIVGERDLPDFHRIAETIEKTVPNARRTVISGAGHMANMEAPQAVNQTVREFLRRS